MEREEAISIVIDMASRWGENAEEGLPTRISPEMLTNDQLWQSVLAGMDEFERDQAIELRDLWRAVALLQRENAP